MTPLRKRFTRTCSCRPGSADAGEPRSGGSGTGQALLRSPDLLSDEEIRAFFLHLINERKSSASTLTIYFRDQALLRKDAQANLAGAIERRRGRVDCRWCSASRKCARFWL
jgi:hypothetical protein